MYYIYMLRCVDNSIYTGITTNINRRLKEHLGTMKGAKYTSVHKPLQFEKVWSTSTRSLASKLEYRIKKLSKSEKEELIKKEKNELLPDIEWELYESIINYF